ncbi:MAG: Na+/H+ antiporter NhaC [Saprospiraceae bacterium]|nr:Na+/H+ antiporter NhaC [Saprospiraceae bacterium]MBP6566127.1 Na+/H+ antiporter NhaC [Saprospiraceae bacterium]
MHSKDIKPELPEQEVIIINKELSITEALFPVIILVGLLAYNIFIFGDSALSGSNQFILIIGAAVAAIVGFRNKVSYQQMMEEVGHNVKSTSGAILILLMVGALSGTWLLSGVIPSMIYYGLQILTPSIFLAASLVICSIVSLATGSSWSTSATVGIALIGIGQTMGINPGMTAGAVISGAYFGDKISPLSDTTNLASAMAGAELFDHIKYMLMTTVPSILVALVVFLIIGFNISATGSPDISDKLNAIDAAFNISPWLFLVPAVVIFLIIKKTQPLVALLAGALLGGIVAIIAQPEIVVKIAEGTTLDFNTAYKGVMKSLTTKTSIETTNPELNDLFSAKGMEGMLGTIWLILCAMVFGGVMDAIGALARISQALLNMFHTVFGLFASTVLSCLAINVTASDQYLALVIPGKMYKKAFQDKGLHPVNLSRTLEDTGTVTSVLVPWNTCGAYNAGVLGVPTVDYFIFAIFNWISPFMTLTVAALGIKIKQLKQ